MNAPIQHTLAESAVDASRQALLAAADSREALCTQWLAWLSEMLPGVRRSFVLLDNGADTLVATAVRPEGCTPERSRAIVMEVVALARPALRPVQGGHEMAFPIVVAQRVRGVVGLEIGLGDTEALRHASTAVHWGMGWLRSALGGLDGPRTTAQLARARQAIDLSLLLTAEPGFKSAAMALANQLCRRFACNGVLLGWLRGGSVRLAARSNSAWHDGRTEFARLAEQAMDEAVDQGLAITLPAPPEPRLAATRAAEAYRRGADAAGLMTVPLRAHGQLVGALLFERSRPFDEAELDSVEALALLVAPLLQLRHGADEGVLQHIGRKGTVFGGWLTGRRHLGAKLLGAGAALLLVLAADVPVTHRVTAPAVVEGQTQRAAAAPCAGYIRSASARAGDVVKAGAVLATLDDKDLSLERVRWQAELELASRKEREAMAGADRVAMRLAAAQAAQAQAQLDLVQEKLRRVQITAPFDAVVVKGDLSQLLGAPVETGKVLFELAPLEAWRVILKVDERDIAWLNTGQRGELVLSSLPGQAFALQTQRILSVAVAEEGRNHFRVEAGLGADAARLRPGMEGVAKVGVGEASLLWVWTHRLTDWLRRTAWEWAP